MNLKKLDQKGRDGEENPLHLTANQQVESSKLIRSDEKLLRNSKEAKTFLIGHNSSGCSQVIREEQPGGETDEERKRAY